MSKDVFIARRFKEIMEALGLDTLDPSLRDTPRRVANMYVNELFRGLSRDPPDASTFPNDKQYDQMILIRDIKVHSICEHHFVPFMGVAHVAYIPNDRLLGLSKFNRIVDHFARRPQVQERLTQQIHEHLCDVLQTKNVAVVIKADHLCVKLRGIQDQGSETITSALNGQFFNDPTCRAEFMSLVK